MGIPKGSAFASVESRGECWLGQLGEPTHLYVMRFKCAAAPLCKASVAARHSGTIGRHLTALLRASAVCLDGSVYTSSSLWFMERPLFF